MLFFAVLFLIADDMLKSYRVGGFPYKEARPMLISRS